MANAEQEFESELEISRTDAQGGIQFLYAFLGLHAVLGAERKILDRVNENSLFWRTVNGALHMSIFMTLGRLFDQRSPHNIDRLVKIAQDNAVIFSKESLVARKRRSSANADEWLPEFLAGVYVPSAEDFRQTRKLVDKNRKVYEATYRPIRDKLYAHKELVDDSLVQAVYSKTNVDELAALFGFLLQAYEALWQLYHNGRPPNWESKVFSANEIATSSLSRKGASALPERMVTEVRDVLRSIA